ncbi:replicative DNA helicase [Catonella morbi ATCC 51271]|jgi:replicative DNA helicase|uniref:Replicative DNA helicase n=1 Tax=Catonella morbi ATCC 51271 TaxID=592026 RepID=V2Y8D7_9FIRM|nr:replicative DNA helicase [Catonella morbi]ESL03941.1 replicative DNA helicase [Catonella morbi ATCC 51271]
MAEEELIKKTPPHSKSAEQSVIGSMILDPETVITVAEILEAEDFYDKRYGLIFSAITGLEKEGKPIDIITIENRIKEMNQPLGAIEMNVLGELVMAVSTSVNVAHHAEIVYKNSLLRKLIKVAEKISLNCYAGESNLEDILQLTEKEIFDLLQKRQVSDATDIKQVIISVIESIEAASKSGGTVTGIPTGFHDLDYKMAGLQNSDLILIAARPSMGKTAFALNIAEYVTVKKNVTTAIFSLEMSKEQLAKRILAMNSRVDSQKLRTGDLSDREWGDIVDSARIIGETNLVIDDTPGISITELRSKCRKLKLEKNLGLVMIDYIQLMTGSKQTESRQQEISEISRSLKALAREINAPIIALSQLSRRVEQRDDKRPMLSDLRESGAIEQDADVVMFIYRDEYYNKDTETPGVTEIIIGKQRNGPIGTVRLGWKSELTKFVNIEREKQ